MPSGSFDDRNWKRLLNEIRSNKIVPIIGPELLLVSIDGKKVLFHDYLAEELAKRLNVEYSSEKGMPLSDVVYAYYTQPGCDPDDPYFQLWDILNDSNFELPDSLIKLASIEPLNLFLTTTFDPFMQNALNRIRFSGDERTQVLSYPIRGKAPDIPTSIKEPIVYHVFSMADPSEKFVVTEEDLLEYGHLWQNKDYRPERLVSLLEQKFIMMLGCNFQNWLARFFICAIKRNQIFHHGFSGRSIVADRHFLRDQELTLFLSRCNTKLYSPGGAVEFIDELYSRWQEFSQIKASSQQTSVQKEAVDFKADSFFISYASEDEDAARLLAKTLKSEGFDVWFDKKSLNPGEQYKEMILHYIERSSFFIPVLSKHVLTQKRRFFRFEWSKAISDLQYRPPDPPFILPVVLDNIDETSMQIPQTIQALHWSRCPGGKSTDEFLNICRTNIRKYRRNQLER